MARRGENIYKRRDGRWEGRYIKGKKPNGKPQYGYVYAPKYSEVKERLMPLKLCYHKRRPHAPVYEGLFRHYVTAWLLEAAEKPVKPSTLAGYRRLVDRHILPALGDRPAAQLRREDVLGFAARLKTMALSAGTVRNILRLLTSVLRRAVGENAVSGDVLEGLVLPRMERKKVPVLTQSEQERLEQGAHAVKNGAAVLLALYTGMRLGEICALRWADVDWEEGVLHVRQTVQRLGSGRKGGKTALCFGPPKTRTSERAIPLPDVVLQYLTRLKADAAGDYVVTCKGGLTDPRVIQYRFKRLLRVAGVRELNFHALRHTFAVRCMERKMDVPTLSQLLGHASVKMTLDVYTDSLLEHKKQAVQTLNGLWSGSGEALSA